MSEDVADEDMSGFPNAGVRAIWDLGGKEVVVHYQETVIWNKAIRLAELVCLLSVELPTEERFGMRSQLTRAAISVPSNTAEGWTRESKRERRQFLSIAHGSLAELHTQLLICERTGWLRTADLTEIKSLIDQTSRMLTVLRRAARHP
ncbi:four helix bundle protein [Pseudomonas sp. CGJS7]|uniref:four helix bundle protein n=1 Tax=Pseudomonas sp. CGJS7 TaxID=3109348 RepID=UPI0030084EDD